MRTVLHSYSFRSYPLDHVLKVARAGSWPAIELSCWHFETGAATHNIREALQAARHSQVPVHCVGYWGDFVTPDETARRQSIDRACRTAEACAEYGVGLMNGSGCWLVSDPAAGPGRDWRGNGSSIAADEHYARGAAAYRELAEYAAGHGVQIAVEVHPNTIHDTVRATARLLDLAGHDNIVVTIDPSNAAALSAEDTDPAITAELAGRIGYFHLKNCVIRDGSAEFEMDASTGVVDNYRWLEWATRSARVPAICVEYCGEGDPHPQLDASRRYLDATLGRIAALQAGQPPEPGRGTSQ